ncbi:MAG: 50S ribosomal protein L30e [Candidatus Marsarchaeota archaeon]|jgi:large subunit ribosomal protein L30e|nr:50S ribosomal protein L30e [Candidatus Marsarchaeota archaeon]
MTDISGSIRLAVDSGEVVLGVRSSVAAIRDNTAKLIIVASQNKKGLVEDVEHIAKLADIKIVKFDGNSMDLGVVCGKQHSVSSLAVISPGNSKILEEV